MVAGGKFVGLQAVSAKQTKEGRVALSGDFQPPEHAALAVRIGDPEPLGQSCCDGMRTKHRMTESVQRAAGDLVGSGADGAAEALGNLISRLVGKSDSANPSRRHVPLLDEVSDALYQTERLAGAGTGHDEYGPPRRLDGAALSCRGVWRRIGGRSCLQRAAQVGQAPDFEGDGGIYASSEWTTRREAARAALNSWH